LRGFKGVIGFDFGISLFGTISFTACTVGGNSFGGFTFFGWGRFRWASVFGVVLILDIPLRGGRSGSKNPSSRRASYSENVADFMVVSNRAACVNKKEPALPRERSRDQPDLDALNKYRVSSSTR
jgi:hypothetical protein